MPKWNAIRSKIHETSCDIICLQETKITNFDPSQIIFLPYCFCLLLVCCIRRSIWGNSNCLKKLHIFGTGGISK
jgi:hypothetical protein